MVQLYHCEYGSIADKPKSTFLRVYIQTCLTVYGFKCLRVCMQTLLPVCQLACLRVCIFAGLQVNRFTCLHANMFLEKCFWNFYFLRFLKYADKASSKIS